MKIMSFNCRGLSSPHKLSALKRVVCLEHPDILLLQEILGVGGVVKVRLESWFPGWIFETLDVRGHSGGLEIRWNERTIKALNPWGMESVLGLKFLALDLEVSFTIFNIYGLYINRMPYLTILNNA